MAKRFKYNRTDGSVVYLTKEEVDKVDEKMRPLIGASQLALKRELIATRRWARRNLCSRQD